MSELRSCWPNLRRDVRFTTFLRKDWTIHTSSLLNWMAMRNIRASTSTLERRALRRHRTSAMLTFASNLVCLWKIANLLFLHFSSLERSSFQARGWESPRFVRANGKLDLSSCLQGCCGRTRWATSFWKTSHPSHLILISYGGAECFSLYRGGRKSIESNRHMAQQPKKL